MVRRLLVPTVLGLVLGILLSLWAITSSAGIATAATSPAYTIKEPGIFIYVPSNAQQLQPVQVLVAMHGMNGDGANFCQNLLATAERNGWIVVAPTFRYQDYKNADLVLQDDTRLLPLLKGTLDSLPGRTGLVTRDRVLLYGHSRGGQAVHRFATYYPERVLGVAAIAAGSYTLPLKTMMVNGRSQSLAMPYGVANMRAHLGHDFNHEAFKRIPFLVQVGGQDSNPDDVPRAWDPYLGRNRIDRAQAYTKTLQNIGVPASLAIYPNTGHGVSPQMHAEALAFLESVTTQGTARYGFGPARATRALLATWR